MKTKFILPILALALTAATPLAQAAPAVTPADKQFLGDFRRVIARNDVEGAKKLIAQPNFSPQMFEQSTERRDNLFEDATSLKSPTIARLMIASPAFKKETWNAKTTARPLIYATYNPTMLPLLQEMSKLPHFDLNTPGADGREFPLRFAANHDNLGALKWLVAQPKVNIAARNEDGDNALFIAGAKATTFLLSLKKIDVNQRNNEGRTALHMAVWEGDKARVRALLAAPTINPNIKSGDGYTPLDIALSQDVEMSEIFMASKKVKPTAAQRKTFNRIKKNGMGGGAG